MFQSTRPRGRTRLQSGQTLDTEEIVSIHASSREDATPLTKVSILTTMVSIHASSREDATTSILPTSGRSLFQSTRPRGRTRRIHCVVCKFSSRFNPRVLAGGRDESCAYVARYIMFQSTRPRGRTRLFDEIDHDKLEVSIHASSREDATPLKRRILRDNRFNPRVLAGGRDPPNTSKPQSSAVSIHASSREDATRE